MRRALAALLALVAGLAGVVVLTAPAASASALPIGQCTTSRNAVVAVNFAHWGGPIVRGCGSTPTTGFQLINQGGFTTTGTVHDGPAFICRIASAAYRGGAALPSKQDDPCVNTPPSNAYWSYWHANAGQDTWSYSQLGAMSYAPKPGSVDYWQFGATNVAGTSGQPAVTPDEVRAQNSAPIGNPAGGQSIPATHAPTSGAATARGDRVGGTQPGRTTGAGTTGAASTASTAAPKPGTSTSSTHATGTSVAASSAPAGGATSSAPSSASSGPTIVDASPVANRKRTSTGSARPVLLALGLVVLLGAGAGWTVLRRRRAEASEL